MNNIFELEDGFYFELEDGDLSGPFQSVEQAQIAADAYDKWYHHDHQENSVRKMRDYYD